MSTLVDKGAMRLCARQCYVIAEIGQAHDGSLGSAHAYIDAVAEAGVDAVKFQTYSSEALYSKNTPLS